MKQSIKTGFKIYSFLLLLIILLLSAYSIYILKTQKNYNSLIMLIISDIIFLFIGMLYGNHFQKKGILIGLVTGIIHIILFIIILFLTTGTFQINIGKITINILTII